MSPFIASNTPVQLTYLFTWQDTLCLYCSGTLPRPPEKCIKTITLKVVTPPTHLALLILPHFFVHSTTTLVFKTLVAMPRACYHFQNVVQSKQESCLSLPFQSSTKCEDWISLPHKDVFTSFRVRIGRGTGKTGQGRYRTPSHLSFPKCPESSTVPGSGQEPEIPSETPIWMAGTQALKPLCTACSSA